MLRKLEIIMINKFGFLRFKYTFDTSTRKIAGSVPEKSVGKPTKNLPVFVISVVIFACGLKGHLATPLSSFVRFKLSILNTQKITFIR